MSEEDKGISKTVGFCIAVLVVVLFGAIGYISYSVGHSEGYSSGYNTAGRDAYCEVCYEGYLRIDPDHNNCVETCITWGKIPEIFWGGVKCGFTSVRK